MATLTAMFHSRLEEHPDGSGRKCIAASRSPSDAQRAVLEERRRELRRSLHATPGPEVRRVILLLLAGGPQYGATEEQAAVRVALYAEAVDDLPTWAIQRARLSFARGGWKCDWNGRGSPSTAHLADEVRGYLAPIWTELRRVEAVLDAVPIATPSAEEVAAAAAERRRVVQAAMQEDRRREAESRAAIAADLERRRVQREQREAEATAGSELGAAWAPASVGA